MASYSVIYAFDDSLSDAGNVWLLTNSPAAAVLGLTSLNLAPEPVSPPYYQEIYNNVTAGVFSLNVEKNIATCGAVQPQTVDYYDVFIAKFGKQDPADGKGDKGYEKDDLSSDAFAQCPADCRSNTDHHQLSSNNTTTQSDNVSARMFLRQHLSSHRQHRRIAKMK